MADCLYGRSLLSNYQYSVASTYWLQCRRADSAVFYRDVIMGLSIASHKADCHSKFHYILFFFKMITVMFGCKPKSSEQVRSNTPCPRIGYNYANGIISFRTHKYLYVHACVEYLMVSSGLPLLNQRMRAMYKTSVQSIVFMTLECVFISFSIFIFLLNVYNVHIPHHVKLIALIAGASFSYLYLGRIQFNLKLITQFQTQCVK